MTHFRNKLYTVESEITLFHHIFHFKIYGSVKLFMTKSQRCSRKRNITSVREPKYHL